jgi:hypothetical protein
MLYLCSRIKIPNTTNKNTIMENTIQPSQERKGFTFYRSYYEAISLLPADDQLTVYKAIMEYSLNGTIPSTEDMSLCARLLIMAFMPNLEANNRRYANGVKGGRGHKADTTSNDQEQPTTEAAPNQAESKAKPSVNQTESKAGANENENENDNENDDEDDNENENDKGNADDDVDAKRGAEARVASQAEVATSATPPTPTLEEKVLISFEKWASRYAPTLLQFPEPMTASQLAELRAKYNDLRIKECAAQMHNKSAFQSNRSVFLTMRKWIKSMK